MELDGKIFELPKYVKSFLVAFVLVLSVGYFTGIQFVRQTDSDQPAGIEENYLGNEDIEEVSVMKFKKSPREMLTILHTHILSLSFVFFFMSALLALTKLPKKLKSFLMVEPFISIILTFGGIYLLWEGVLWMKWIVMLSGVLMTLVFVVSALILLSQLLRPKPE